MANHLDMSLDDIIKKTKSGRGRGRGRNYRGGIVRGGGPFTGVRRAGPIRRAPLGVNARPSSYTIAKTIRKKSFPWQTDLLEDSLRASGIPGLESGTKLYVSNLDYGVSNEDIRELFSEIGELRRYAIHYDKNGYSTGSAEVVYVRRSDAFAALRRYNDVQLDGKPMKIEILGTNSKASVSAPVSARVNVIGGFNGRRTVVMRPGMVPPRGPPAVFRGSNQRNRGGSTMGRGRGRGRGRGSVRGGRGGKTYRVDKSADELDRELDNYHAEAMQT